MAVARVTSGPLPDDEGMALYRSGRLGAEVGPLMEIGAWRGRSAVYLGTAAAEIGTALFSVDHHRGPQERRAGRERHGPAVVDARSGRIDTLPFFGRTIEEAGLESAVIAVVGESSIVAARWGTPPALVFVDGGHGAASSSADYDGGRPPYELHLRACRSGAFEELPEAGCGSPRVLQRVSV